MQASLRPFVVRSFPWFKPSRISRLNGGLGFRSLSVSSQHPEVSTLPESLLSSQPNELAPIPAKRRAKKKESLSRKADLTPLDDIVPALPSSATEGEKVSDDPPTVIKTAKKSKSKNPFGTKAEKIQSKAVEKKKTKKKKSSEPPADTDANPTEEDLDITPTLTGPPPRLVFGRVTAIKHAALPASGAEITRSTPPSARDRNSAALLGLPPFVTLSDVGRIALHAGASPGDVIGVQLWVKANRHSSKPENGEGDGNDGVNANDKVHADTGTKWMLGATIHFRDSKTAHDFRATPLLLEVRPSTNADRPQVHVFPSAEDADRWTPARLAQFAEGVPSWSMTSRHALRAALSPQADEHTTEPGDRTAIMEDTATVDQELWLDSAEEATGATATEQEMQERAKVLQSMWSRLETPLDQSLDQSVDEETESPPPPPPPIDRQAQPNPAEQPRELESDLQSAEELTPPTGLVISVPVRIVQTHEAEMRWIKNARPTDTRWLALRVPGSGVPIFASDPSAPSGDPVAPPAAEEPEHEDPTVQLYALALRKALARERELERDLQAARTEAQERVLETARATAEAQVRADFGAFGALEGVWIRGVRVRAPAPRGAPQGDVGTAEMGGEGEAEPWVYEMHALVAFAEAQAAARARTVVPAQVPAYARAGLRFVSDPWREALGGSAEAELPGGAREGWARRLEREHAAEALARKREKERERQRGAAEGTWGKERLSEIRERLKRMQRRTEREREREVAWARTRERATTAAANSLQASAAAAAFDGTTVFDSDIVSSSSDSDSDSDSDSTTSDSDSSESDSDSDDEVEDFLPATDPDMTSSSSSSDPSSTSASSPDGSDGKGILASEAHDSEPVSERQEAEPSDGQSSTEPTSSQTLSLNESKSERQRELPYDMRF
ncbi:hypothetical protein B0H19DRAFT_1267367 [Mycena capillaripes]|nr:hypothetical protein B0H19DRAFT_1267367 [Mycena capillaripes]